MAGEQRLLFDQHGGGDARHAPADAPQVRAAGIGAADAHRRQHARVLDREELERLRLIKHLVDELGINLAGVQRLLQVAEVMQRIRPLMDENALTTGAGRRQLVNEIRRLNEAIGL